MNRASSVQQGGMGEKKIVFQQAFLYIPKTPHLITQILLPSDGPLYVVCYETVDAYLAEYSNGVKISSVPGYRWQTFDWFLGLVVDAAQSDSFECYKDPRADWPSAFIPVRGP